MKIDKLDEHMKHALHKHTDSMLQHKEELWNSIEQEIKKQPLTNEGTVDNTKKRSTNLSWIVGLAATVSIIGLFTSTNTGQAFVEQIKLYFEPKIQIVEQIEGITEEKEVVLQESKAGYVIYIDEERYKLVSEENQDRIVPLTPLGETYPEISMSIQQSYDESPVSVIERIKHELALQYDSITDEVAIAEPLQATLITAMDTDQQWDSKIANIYVLPNELGGSFIITSKYFLEASEGHGARFHTMLKSFVIVQE